MLSHEEVRQESQTLLDEDQPIHVFPSHSIERLHLYNVVLLGVTFFLLFTAFNTGAGVEVKHAYV